MASDQKPQLQYPSAERSLVSLLIFLHLCCVAAVLLANFARSHLQERLLSIFAPYTQSLNLDPDKTPYYLTHGDPDSDCVMVVDLYSKGEEPVEAQQRLATVQLPDSDNRWLGGNRRYISLAQAVAAHVGEGERDDVTGEIARAVARRMMDENNAKRAVFRCLQRMAQPLMLSELQPGYPADKPTDPRYDVLLYEADVWYDEDGQVQVVKRSGIGEVAPRASTAKSAGGSTRPAGS